MSDGIDVKVEELERRRDDLDGNFFMLKINNLNVAEYMGGDTRKHIEYVAQTLMGRDDEIYEQEERRYLVERFMRSLYPVVFAKVKEMQQARKKK